MLGAHSSGPGPRSIGRALGALLILTAASPSGRAQDIQGQTPTVDQTTLALGWIQGRFRSPVTCILANGDRVEIEEAIAIRRGRERSAMPVVRVTFFGIDLPEARKCFSIVSPEIPDRRGVLYLTYRSNRRSDLGMVDFRRALRSGDILYHVVDGRLTVRPIVGDAEPRVIRFDARDYPFHVRPVLRNSDDDKLLSRYGVEEDDPGAKTRRRLRFKIEGPDSFRFAGAFIEDEPR